MDQRDQTPYCRLLLSLLQLLPESTLHGAGDSNNPSTECSSQVLPVYPSLVLGQLGLLQSGHLRLHTESNPAPRPPQCYVLLKHQAKLPCFVAAKRPRLAKLLPPATALHQRLQGRFMILMGTSGLRKFPSWSLVPDMLRTVPALSKSTTNHVPGGTQLTCNSHQQGRGEYAYSGQNTRFSAKQQACIQDKLFLSHLGRRILSRAKKNADKIVK